MQQKLRELRGRREIARQQLALGLEASGVLLVASVLIEGLHYIDQASTDLQAAFVLALLPFCTGLILLFQHVNQLLDLLCPRCEELFHGDGLETLSIPFRRHCAHCGLPASPHTPPPFPGDEVDSNSW